MKYKVLYTNLLLFACALISIAPGNTSDDKNAVSAPAPTRSVAISSESVTMYADSQKRIDDARKILESTPAFKDLVIAQQNQQVVLYHALAEAGLKPSDKCQPVVKEGVLVSFECPVPASGKK